MVLKELTESFRFACTLSFWRMVFLWTFSLIFSYVKLLTQSIFNKKLVYRHCPVSPLPTVFGRLEPICIVTGVSKTICISFVIKGWRRIIRTYQNQLLKGFHYLVLRLLLMCTGHWFQATSGLGAAAALALSREGFFVVLGVLSSFSCCNLLISYCPWVCRAGWVTGQNRLRSYGE